MSNLPDTHASLLLRIRNPADAEAWARFVDIDRPVLYRVARRWNLQDPDAQDLAQQVLTSVSRAIGRWKSDGSSGRFRAWLLKVARHALINEIARRPCDASRGGTSVIEQLNRVPDHDDTGAQLDDEHRRAVFRWAAADVKTEFSEVTSDPHRDSIIRNRLFQQYASLSQRCGEDHPDVRAAKTFPGRPSLPTQYLRRSAPTTGTVERLFGTTSHFSRITKRRLGHTHGSCGGKQGPLQTKRSGAAPIWTSPDGGVETVKLIRSV
jgi:RNA polymerase sigma-70 factor (ECF subfamily)